MPVLHTMSSEMTVPVSSCIHCPNCLKEFKNARNINRHMSLHCKQKTKISWGKMHKPKSDRNKKQTIDSNNIMPPPLMDDETLEMPCSKTTHTPPLTNIKDLALPAGKKHRQVRAKKSNGAVTMKQLLSTKSILPSTSKNPSDNVVPSGSSKPIILNENENNSDFECATCCKVYKHKRTLVNHIRKECGNAKNITRHRPLHCNQKTEISGGKIQNSKSDRNKKQTIDSNNMPSPLMDDEALEIPCSKTHTPPLTNNKDLALPAGKEHRQVRAKKTNCAVTIGTIKQMISNKPILPSTSKNPSDNVVPSASSKPIILNENENNSDFECATCCKVYKHKRTLVNHIRKECGNAKNINRHRPLHCNQKTEISGGKIQNYKSDRNKKQRIDSNNMPTPLMDDEALEMPCSKTHTPPLTNNKDLALPAGKKHRQVRAKKTNCAVTIGTIKQMVGNKPMLPSTSKNPSDNVEPSASSKPIVLNENEDNSGFECATCCKVYKHKRTLVFHIKQECGKDFRCPSCKRWFTYKKDLKSHMKYKCGHVFKCSKCGDKFKQKSNFNKHEKYECGKILECPGCSRIYHRKSSLDRHMAQCEKMKLI